MEIWICNAMDGLAFVLNAGLRRLRLVGETDPFPIVLAILGRWVWILKRESLKFRGCVSVMYLLKEEKFNSTNTGAQQDPQPENEVTKASISISSTLPTLPQSPIPHCPIPTLSIPSIPPTLSSTRTIHSSPSSIPSTNSASQVPVLPKKRNGTTERTNSGIRTALAELLVEKVSTSNVGNLETRFSLGVCPGPKCSVWPITHRDFRDLHLLANQSSSISG